MKYVDGFRNPEAAASFNNHIAELGRLLAKAQRRVNVMEVCGTHTVAIARYGIRQSLPSNVELISGPGCPVCVTDPGYIDTAIELAERGVTIFTFGDMIHVPGSTGTLAECRSRGGKIEVCYSPTAVLEAAALAPSTEFVFLAIGFETTIPPVISIVDGAMNAGLKNISMLTSFKLVPPAMHALLSDPEIRIDAFLCPAHVSAIIGANAYSVFAERYHVPCVIAGFEPLDILFGIQGILAQLAANEARVENQYNRVVKDEGNPKAKALMEKYLQPIDASWRGVGVIPASGLGLREEYAAYDAVWKMGVPIKTGKISSGCRCGDVIKGKCHPPDCPLFGKACVPDHAVGPCMVSSEGTCAAFLKYIPCSSSPA